MDHELTLKKRDMEEISKGQFQYKDVVLLSYQYKQLLCEDKMNLQPFYLYIGISCTVKTTHLYWNKAQK